MIRARQTNSTEPNVIVHFVLSTVARRTWKPLIELTFGQLFPNVFTRSMATTLDTIVRSHATKLPHT